MATRPRQSTAQPTASQRSTINDRPPAGTGNTDLPDYEPTEFSLTPAAQRALAQLARTHNGSKLTERLNQAHAHVTDAAVDINDILYDREKVTQRVKAKRQEAEDDGEDGTLDQLEEDLAQLRTKVKGMTDKMEQRVRKIIDAKHAVKNMTDAVTATADDARNNASTQASTLNRRSQRMRQRRGSDGEEEESDGEELPDFDPTDPAAGTAPVNPPLDVFNKKLDEMNTRYQAFDYNARYGEDNDYRNFKRAVHDAQYRDDEVQLPHHTEWFNHDGTVAALGVTDTQTGGEEGSDDDIAVSRATMSTKCSLSLKEFEHPITSTKCPHSFERVHILEFIRNSAQRLPAVNGRHGEKAVQCPVSGCTQMLSKNDLRVDPVVVRKIQRLQRARELEREEDDEDGDRSPNGTQRRAHEIIDDDDDEEDATNIDGMDADDPPVNPKQEPRATVASRGVGSAPPRPSQAVDLLDDDEEDEEGEESLYD